MNSKAKLILCNLALWFTAILLVWVGPGLVSDPAKPGYRLMNAMSLALLAYGSTLMLNAALKSRNK